MVVDAIDKRFITSSLLTSGADCPGFDIGIGCDGSVVCGGGAIGCATCIALIRLKTSPLVVGCGALGWGGACVVASGVGGDGVGGVCGEA